MAILTGYDREQVHSVSVWNPPPKQSSHRWKDGPGARSYLDLRVVHPHPTTRLVLPERSTRSNPTSLPIRFAQTSGVDPIRPATSTGPAGIAGPSASTRPGWIEPSNPPARSCPDHFDPVDPESTCLHRPRTQTASDAPPEAAWHAPVQKVRIDQCHPQRSRANQPARIQRHRRVTIARLRSFPRNRALCDPSQLERRLTGPARSTFHLSATSGRSECSAGPNVIDF